MDFDGVSLWGVCTVTSGKRSSRGLHGPCTARPYACQHCPHHIKDLWMKQTGTKQPSHWEPQRATLNQDFCLDGGMSPPALPLCCRDIVGFCWGPSTVLPNDGKPPILGVWEQNVWHKLLGRPQSTHCWELETRVGAFHCKHQLCPEPFPWLRSHLPMGDVGGTVNPWVM